MYTEENPSSFQVALRRPHNTSERRHSVGAPVWTNDENTTQVEVASPPQQPAAARAAEPDHLDQKKKDGNPSPNSGNARHM